MCTCRGQDQRLQDVRQRDDADDTRLLINDNQPVNLHTHTHTHTHTHKHTHSDAQYML